MKIGLFYSGLAPYTGHAPLGFMSALETCQSFIGSGTTSYSHRWCPSRMCAENISSQQVGTIDPLRVLNSSLLTLHLLLLHHKMAFMSALETYPSLIGDSTSTLI